MGNDSSKPSKTSTISASTKPEEIITETSEPEVVESSNTGLNMFDFVITTIDVIVKDNVEDVDNYGEGAKYVEFHGKIKAEKDDTDVAFLLNVREKDASSKHPVFTAICVSKETFAEKLAAENKKVLGCIHGFTVEPEQWLAECAQIATHDDFAHLVLPIIWPSVGKNIFRYDEEQSITRQAGEAFASVAGLGQTVPLSIMAHSMGNRVLMSYALEAEVDQKFENVFMVAADVWEEVFNERVISDTWFQPPWNYFSLWKDAGLKLCNSMKDGRKIHIINYECDRALIGSWVENRRRRIGRFGKDGQRGRIDERCDDKLVGFDMKPFKDEVKETDSAFLHSYHYMPRLAKYYSDTMNE